MNFGNFGFQSSPFIRPGMGSAIAGPMQGGPYTSPLPPMNFGSSGGGFIPKVGRGIGAFLMGNGGENALNLAGLAAGAYGAYRQGKAEDREFESLQEERAHRRELEEQERQRRASADPARMALIQRLLAGNGQ